MVVLLAIRFLSELALLAALAVAAAGLAGGRTVAGIAAMAAVAMGTGVWGALVAPKARHRLADPWRLAAELTLFASATAGLAVTGHGTAAAIFLVISIGAAVLVRFVPATERTAAE